MTPPNLMVIGLQIRKLPGRGGGICPPVLPDSEKLSLFRVNRTLLIFLASRLGFLLSFYFVYTDPLSNAADFLAEIS